MEAIPPPHERPGPGETLVFVYGTLKRGQANHPRLAGAPCLGEVALEGASLYDLGPFPMAIAGKGRIGGELYAVAWEALRELDVFEGCPRLYQRHWLTLADGRQAWVYLGHPRQVRHVKRLPGGLWPSSLRCSPWVWWASASMLLLALQPSPAGAAGFDTLGACQSWRSSHGAARVELANAIGAAHYLTKRHAFQESSPGAPVDLYSPSDLQRVCSQR